MRYLDLLEPAKEAASRAIAPDDGMFNTGKDWYFQVGASGLRLCLNALHAGGVPEVRTVLDLPCGHGRVARFLRAAFPVARMTFCDLDRSGVDFCAASFNGRGVHSEPELERVAFAHRFDLIWVGSLLTHVDWRRYEAWIGYLCRQLADGGVLVATVHGFGAEVAARKYPMIHPAAWERVCFDFNATGFGYADYDKPGFDNYGVSLCRPSKTVELVENVPGVRLLGYQERGWGDNHDVLAIQRTDRLKPWP